MTRFITTPVYYVNDTPHIGHAYTTLAADTLARFFRLKGESVLFVTGTDEHGQKVARAAQDAGVPTKEFVDRTSDRFKKLAADLHITHDRFIRTTDNDHMQSAQAFWRHLEENGWIYEGVYAGWYSVRDEAFFDENEIVDGCAPTGAPVEWMEEPTLFFALSRMQEKLLTFHTQHPDHVQPIQRRHEVMRFMESGLKDLAISRSKLTWGIPVPNHTGQVMYVWLDALTNYLTAVGYPNTQSDGFLKYWPNALHIVGKDIVRFHAVYWPAFLIAAGITHIPKVYAHGWWTNEGRKISKSLGNTICPNMLLQQYGLDAIRYFLLREVPFGGDGHFYQENLRARYQSDLAHNYGNLVQRVLSFIVKNNIMPIASKEREMPVCCVEALEIHMEKLALNRALVQIWQWLDECNQYMDHQKPWVLRKTDPHRCAVVLYQLVERIRQITIVVQPFLVQASARVLDWLHVEGRMLEDIKMPWAPRIPTAPMPLFPSIDTEAALLAPNARSTTVCSVK